MRAFQKDAIIGPYWGTWLAGQARQRRETEFGSDRLVLVTLFGGKFVIDGDRRCLTTHINSRKPPNVRLVQDPNIDDETDISANFMRIEVMQDLQAGEELFLDYTGPWNK